MAFESFCGALIALLFGVAIIFGGYRFFLILLPIWGFFAGFVIGAESMQALFGVGFLATVTSWVVGFLVGVIFALLSYLFYIIGVALLAGSFGYALDAGLMGLIGVDFGFLVWAVGLVVGVAVAAVTIIFNIQKWVIIAITAFGGAGIVVGVLLSALGKLPTSALVQNPVRVALQDSPLWLIFFLVLGVVGVVAQVSNTKNFVLEAPENRI